jgi:iron complex outermembrane receptor protein
MFEPLYDIRRMKPDFVKTQKTIAALTLPGALLAQTAHPQTDATPEAASPHAAATPVRMPKVVVTAPLPDGAPLDAQRADTSPRARIVAQDTAALLEDVPGTAVVRNGPQTGIVQLRGLSGDRVKVAVDGMTLTPACPNHMDPPLHYAAPTSLDTLTVMAGITPVSLGGDSLGGTVLALPPPPRFATNEQALGFGELGGFYRSNNDGYGFNGEGGVANQYLSAAYQGSWQRANDLRFPGGRVHDTGFDTQQHNLLAGLRTPQGVWSVDAGLLRTRDAGTPALPMDMIQDDGYRIGLKHQGDYSFGAAEGRFYFHTIDHLMDNYSLRPVAPGGMRMFSPATSDDLGVNLGLAIPKDLHTFRVGTGFHLNLFDAYQQNAGTGAQQDTLNDASRARVGTYAEWQANWSEQWSTILGVRNDTVISDAADLSRWFNTGPVPGDAARFNASGHDFLDVNFDATASVRFRPNAWSAYELGLARKNRAPSLLERYLWTPLSASAGQADGRTYLGNLDLDPETSHQVALTADWHGPKWQVQVTPFYNLVSDYVQGAPIARRDSSGRPVLQFQNMDSAELYGVEGLARYEFDEHFALRGSLSYVRGRNRDTDDNLYRIAPLHGTLGLDHRWRGLESAIEVVLVDDQNKVAAYNAEPRTPGYALLHLRTGFAFRSHLRVQLGLENVTNERYADHLGGINRVLGSDVAVGQRIPGAGRFVYAAVSYRF